MCLLMQWCGYWHDAAGDHAFSYSYFEESGNKPAPRHQEWGRSCILPDVGVATSPTSFLPKSMHDLLLKQQSGLAEKSIPSFFQLRWGRS